MLFDLDAITPRDVRALSALNDSKQHTPEAREELYPLVMRLGRRVHIVCRCARGIDGRGLHKTNLAALRDALRGVARPGVMCLSDGFPLGRVRVAAQRAIVDGDTKSAAIAAASIVAKVSRDRLHAPCRGAAPGVGLRRACRLLDARAPRGHPPPRGQPRCTGARSRALAYQQLEL